MASYPYTLRPFEALHKSGERKGQRKLADGTVVFVYVSEENGIGSLLNHQGSPFFKNPWGTVLFKYRGNEEDPEEVQDWNGIPVPSLVKWYAPRKTDGPLTNFQWEWRYQGQLHREDGPAVVRGDGTNEWWRYGLLHRADGPAKGGKFYLYGVEVDPALHECRRKALAKRKSHGETWASHEVVVESHLSGKFKWKYGDFSMEERYRKGKLQDSKEEEAVLWRHPQGVPLLMRFQGGFLHNEPGFAAVTGPSGPLKIRKNPHESLGMAFSSASHQEFWVHGVRHNPEGPSVIRGKLEEWWFLGERLTKQAYKARIPLRFVSPGPKILFKLNRDEHREDGPSFTDENGSQRWKQKGVFHREDGPANIVYNERGKRILQEWYCHGKRHREDDEPAVVAPGREEWYRHGQLHREDFPALIDLKEEIELWMEDGVFHRVDGPAEIRGGVKKWWIRGDLHREDGPAIFSVGREEYFKEGLRHRKGGPALILCGEVVEYWEGGLRHRRDGPAITHNNGSKEWWFNGMRHRKGGPAVIHKDGSEEWWVDGVRLPQPKRSEKGGVVTYTLKGVYHREDGPAFMDSNTLEDSWWKEGNRHRIGGPAVDAPDRKEWWVEGVLHRVDGPAVDTVDLKQWYCEGKPHREDGPAVIRKTCQEWWFNGERHRFDGPAIENSTNGAQCWYIFGRLHRDDGPAVSFSNRSPQFYLGGVEYSEEEHGKRRSYCDQPTSKTQIWMKDGVKYRLGAPAVISPTNWVWHEDPSGKIHRDGGPSMISTVTGDMRHPHTIGWSQHGEWHREEGPAVIEGSHESWYRKGKLHREGGPAVSASSGEAPQWWFDGEKMTKEEYHSKHPLKQVDPQKTVYMNDKGQYHRVNGPAYISADGLEEWRLHGKKHRVGGPAVSGPRGTEWWFNGFRHREDGPAIEWEDGSKEWWCNGQLHREEGPAVEKGDTKHWYYQGHWHCMDGPAVIRGTEEEWFWLGQRHREGGPAVLREGIEEWWHHGELHREGAPARIHNGVEEWWCHGKRHREDGPAFAGNWFLFGRAVQERDVPMMLAVMPAMMPAVPAFQPTPVRRMVLAKAGMDVVLASLQTMLGVPDAVWKTPLMQGALRAGVPVLLHSQIQDSTWKAWMQACLEAAMLQGGSGMVEIFRSLFDKKEVREVIQAFGEEEL